MGDPVAEPILSIDKLSVGYTDEPVVVDFSIDIAAGSISTIIGPNGAGKSTLLRAIYGQNRYFSGTIHFGGRTIERLSPKERLKLGVGLVPQGRCNFPLMTVRENLELGAYTLRGPATGQAIDEVLTRFPLLAAKLGVLAGNLSGGEQQILETAMVLEAGPKLLLLDEPSLGLSPILVQQIFSIIQEINQRGTTILLVEQNALQALTIADRGYVLQTGQVVLSGPSSDLRENEMVRKAYLGES